MAKSGNGDTSYIRRVQEDTRNYIQNLLKENETLSTLLAGLENEKNVLEEQFLQAQKQLDQRKSEQRQLQEKLAEIEDDRQRFAKEYAEIERLNSNLANLYVASYRLHGTLDREEVLKIIQEIIFNLIGSEEVAIYEVGPGENLSLSVASFDIDRTCYERIPLSLGARTCYERIPLGMDVIGRVVETAEPYFSDGSDDDATTREEARITACIALIVEGKVTGAVAIFRLLPQKRGLEQLDHELLDLLATHAATALYCAGLHVRMGAEIGITS